MSTAYCVTVEVLLDGHSPLDPTIDDPDTTDRLDALITDLEDAGLYPSVEGDVRGWSAIVTVDADDMAAARDAAVAAVLGHANNRGLPTDPVVRIEVVREDVRDAELDQALLPDLVSGPEAAQILEVSRQRLHQLAHEHPDFPAPVYRLAAGSIWARSAIERFAETWERRVGRPARKSA
ncbi:hypothetical protein [Phytoactinopolyspora limicola]|uniref:hypothetical protein n=1 Tax=Phytoactinopolyspora limicola TaxID=2715536 RepID=UPI00140C80F7|nr:hypothetical protein [Phytoactinopolyspora limicola]